MIVNEKQGLQESLYLEGQDTKEHIVPHSGKARDEESMNDEVCNNNRGGESCQPSDTSISHFSLPEQLPSYQKLISCSPKCSFQSDQGDLRDSITYLFVTIISTSIIQDSKLNSSYEY